MKVNTATYKKLLESGWTLSRKIDATDIINALSNEDYKVSDYALKVIESFGYLELDHPAFRMENEIQKLHFNPIKACENIYREKVEDYEERAGESLTVIGEAYDDYITLMISETGKIYGGYDDDLSFFGNSFAEALDAIYLSREIKKI